MRMHSRICVVNAGEQEFRVTSYTVRNKDVGTLQVALWNPDRQDWELQELARDDVRNVRDFMNAWLGEGN